MSRGQGKVIKAQAANDSALPFAVNGSNPDIEHVESAMMRGHIVLTESGGPCERSLRYCSNAQTSD